MIIILGVMLRSDFFLFALSWCRCLPFLCFLTKYEVAVLLDFTIYTFTYVAMFSLENAKVDEN